MAKEKKKTLNFYGASGKGQKLSFYAKITNVDSDSINISYKAILNNVRILNERVITSELDDAIFLLWIKDVRIDGIPVTALQFLTEFASEKEKTFTMTKDGEIKLELPQNLTLVEKVSCLTFEIVVDKVDNTVDSLFVSIDFLPNKLDADKLWAFYLDIDHKSKSLNNLSNLAALISISYNLSPKLANEIWNKIWDENKLLKGLQVRYFILVIFKNLIGGIGISDAVQLLLMENYRLRLILEQDYYGTDDVLKCLGAYFIGRSLYENYIDVLHTYQKINNFAENQVIEDQRLAAILYAIIEPQIITYDKINHKKIVSSNEYFVGNNQLLGFYDFLKNNYYGSRFYYLTSAILSIIRRTLSEDEKSILACFDVLVDYTFYSALNFLYLHRNQLQSIDVDMKMRMLIAKWDLNYELLEDKKEWVEKLITNPIVSLGFFEIQKGNLSEFAINYMIEMITEEKWDILKECFKLVVTNGDSCRVRSLIGFIYSGAQLYNMEYKTSKTEYGIFSIEIKSSGFCGVEYPQFREFSKKQMSMFLDLLLYLKNQLNSFDREVEDLNKSINMLKRKLR